MAKYVVVDLEMCNIPKKQRTKEFHWAREIIQIGAVLLDDNLEVVDRFMEYVSPEFGQIDKYITNLTGITEEDLKGAPRAEEALERFINWLPKDAILVSWSTSDEIQFRNEVEGKGIEIEGLDGILAGWIDCQVTFSEKMNSSKTYKLSEALVIADIDFEEQEHDGLIDAYNTALLFAKMEKEPMLQLSEYYNDSGEEVEATYNPFAAILGNLDLVTA